MNQITVFTPTYNRAYCLNKCYESMQRQTCQDFDWLIVDDGSTDGTKELVDSWMNEGHRFNIRYIYKENGGMHTGYNTAYENIETELAMNIDSDDYMTDTAIEDVLTFWNANKREDVGGFYALDQYEDGTIIGGPYPDDLKEFRGWGAYIIFYEDRGKKKKYVIKGDKKFIGVTSKLKQYPPIPVFEGEKFHGLGYKEYLLHRDYTILIMNKPVCVVEYMADGSSRNIYMQYIKNPNGFRDERRFIMKNAPIFALRFRAAVHYVAESIIAKDKMFLKTATNKPCVVLAIPAGIVVYIWIQSRVRLSSGQRRIKAQ